MPGMCFTLYTLHREMNLILPPQNYPLRLVAVLALLTGVFLLLLNVYLWWRFHVHLPMHDTAHLLPQVQAALDHGFMSIPLGDWMTIHAGAHRIAITRLLMAADFRYFGGQNHLIFASAWLSMLVMLLLYVAAFRRSYRSAHTLLIFVIGLVLVFLSSPTLFWNLINPINSSWYVAFTASALAIWLVANKPTTLGFPAITVAYFIATIGALSNFAGVLVWLLLPALIALKSYRVGLLTALLSMLIVWLYLRGVAPDFGSQNDAADMQQRSASLLQQGVAIVTRAGEYLGSPLSIKHPQLANALVLASFAPLIIGWLILLTLRLSGRYRHDVWFELTLSMATLCLGVALATQMGREFLWQPTAERYQNVVMMYWLNVCGLLLRFALQARTRQVVWQLSAALLCVAVAALLLTPTSDSVNRAVRDSGRVKEAAVLGQLGVTDKWLNRRILNRNSRDYFSDFSAFFARYNLAYMADKTHHIDAGAPRQCGQVDLEAVPSRWPGIYKLSGTIDDYSSKWYRRLPVATAGGEIMGAIYPVYDEKLTVTHLLLQRHSRWEGYFRWPATSQFASSERSAYLHYRSPPYQKVSCRITF